MKKSLLALSVLLLVSAQIIEAGANLRPDKVQVADSKKTKSYIKDGLIVGGDQAINQVVVKDIRRANNAGFERIVIDLEGSRNGEPAAIPRAPYYQVAVSPEERRLVVTVWGRPKLAFDAKKVHAAFKKSGAVKSVQLLPALEEDSWTFAFELKQGKPVEVFELADPVRVIIDVSTRDVRTGS